MQDFTQLKVWQKAEGFTVNLYKMTADFPSEEKFPKGYRFAYGLTNQYVELRFPLSLIWQRAAVAMEISGGQHLRETHKLRPQNLVDL